ncbi:type II toxin-antitoxin system MqsA family antitoxin [Roseateles sp.]|uniref:type II toxin-antitoxin system MqsA family antitoxin n=1 Tax=Roseateles sp. TaxID=1971397 RepID=UPI0031E114D5
MKCPVCGAAELVQDTRDMEHLYKGNATVIPDVVGDYCPACDECLMEPAESDRVIRAMNDFEKQVNAEAVDPSFIVRVRKKLALDQREAAALFGGGVNGFSRYETGKTQPPLSLIQLLRVLDRHPSLLDEIRASTP